MNQIADILKLADEAQRQKVDAVLATVVHTEGSAYRRAGAMMLILEDGRSVGMISGGCLEPHIIKRAFWLTRNGANVQIYQTGDDIEYTESGEAKAAAKEETSENDFLNVDFDDEPDLDLDELNFGLGCNGRVHVLFERLATATPLLDIISQVRHTQQPVTIATLIRCANCQNLNSELQIGMRIDLDNYTESGQITTIGADNIGINKETHQARADTTSVIVDTVKKLAQHELDSKNAKYIVVKDDNNNDNANLATEWLVQSIQPQIRLLICGAGDDVMPLVTMAKLQDWHVTVIDSRPRYATRLRFSQADKVIQLPLDATDKLLRLSENAAVALMSHSLTQDRTRLATLLEHANHYKYIGQLGPRYRTERLINEISATQADPSVLNAGINKLHYPIGYKLGGDGPEALALGIMAEINAVMHGQTPPAKCVDLVNSNIVMMSHA